MGPPSYMRSVIDRNVVMQRMTVYQMFRTFTCLLIRRNAVLPQQLGLSQNKHSVLRIPLLPLC